MCEKIDFRLRLFQYFFFFETFELQAVPYPEKIDDPKIKVSVKRI